jgi:hypothetical protein
LPQKSSKGRSVQQTLDHQSYEEEDEVSSQDSDTEKVELGTFDDKIVSSSTGKDTAFSKEVASDDETVLNLIDKEKSSVLSSSTEKDEAVSEEVASKNEVVSSTIDKEEASEHAAGANVEVVSGIADRRKRNSKPRVEARLRDKPYGYYANVQVVSSITEKSNASSEGGASDEIVSRSTNLEASVQKSDFAVERNDVVLKTNESSSPSGDVKSDSPDDDYKYIPYSNAPSKSTSKRKAAWFLPSIASSPTNERISTDSEEAKEDQEQTSNANP